MADIQVWVDGSNRSHLVDRDNRLSYSRDINGQGNASFVLADLPPTSSTPGFVPDDGMEVLIKEDGVDRFGGIINGRPRAFKGPDSAEQLTFYNIDVASWEQRLNKRRVWRVYTDQTFGAIAADLVTDFVTPEGLTSSILAGSSGLSITFNGETIAEAFDRLCSLETDGRVWYVTPGKVLTVAVQSGTAAPAVLDRTNVELKDPAPTIEPDRTGYANTVTVVGGNAELPILYTAEDSGEIAARAAAEGGSGVYHEVVEDTEARTAGQVQQRAEGILQQRKTLRDRFKAKTYVAGFDVAQQVNIDLPNLEVDVADDFFIIGVETVWAPGEFWHTITAIKGEIDGSWQSQYRRNIKPRTIPMQIEATPGLVRVDPRPGVLIHDPTPEPALWFQGELSGTLDNTPSAVGISHQGEGDGGFVFTIRRGGAANTGGCGGGQFPGCAGSCFANRQSVVEGYAIDANEKVATSPSVCASWDELSASSFKVDLVVKPDNTLVAFIERDVGSEPIFGVAGVDGSGFRGSCEATGAGDNNTGFEGAWVGNRVYIPSSTTGGVIFIFDVSDPDNPALQEAFNTSATGTISSVVPNRAGTALYAREEGGSGLFIAINITDPANPVEADTQATTDLDFISLDIDEDGSFDDPALIAFTRADANNIRYARLPLTDAHTFGTLDEDTVALATGSFEGWRCVYFEDSAIAFRNRNPQGASNTQQAHVFSVTPDDGVQFVETLSYTHPAAGNLYGSRSYIGARVASWFGFNTNAQITYAVEQFDKVEPYEIEAPLRTQFGGTGLDGDTFVKGDLLAATGAGVLARQPIGLEGAILRARAEEATGMRWEPGFAFNIASIDDADSPYAVATGVVLVLADATAGPVTVTLPPLANHDERLIVIKNDGDGSNAVTVDGNGVEAIDGDATRVLTEAGQVLGVVGNAAAAEWEVVIGEVANVTGADHGTLSGLGDDDHTQYLLVDASRNATGRFTVETGTNNSHSHIESDASQEWQWGSAAGDFRIKDETAGVVVVSIEAGSDANSLYVRTASRVGIGLSSPQVNLHAVKSGDVSLAFFDTYLSAIGGSGYTGRKARGTSASPSAVAANDFLAVITARGYHSGSAFSSDVARIVLHAAEAFTSSAQGTYITLQVTPTGSTTVAEVARISQDGNFGLGVTAWGTSAAKVYGGALATAPTTQPADMFQMYGADASGAGTCSPHFMNEEGDVIHLRHQGNVSPIFGGSAGATYDSNAQNLINNNKTRLAAIVTALDNLGIITEL